MREYLVPLGSEVEIEEIRIGEGYCRFKHFRGKSPYASTNGYLYSTTERKKRGNLSLQDGKLMHQRELTIEDNDGNVHKIRIVDIRPEGMLLKYLGIEE